MKMPDLTTAVLKGADKIDATKTWPHDRSAFLNASEAEFCIRRQWFSKREAPAASQDWGFARRGSHGELYVIDAMRAADLPVTHPVTSIADEELRVSCTPDAILAYPDEWILVEIKTIDPRTNIRKLPKHGHHTQLDIGIGLVSKHLKPTGVKCSRGIILYMDASNFNTLYQFEVQHDPTVLDRMAAKSKRIFEVEDPSILDREGKRTDECRLCPYTEACNVVIDAPKPQKFSNEAPVVIEYDRVQTEIKNLEDRKAELKDEIISMLGAPSIREIEGITVKYEQMPGKKTLDKKAAEKAGIDLSPFYKTGAPFAKLTVSKA